MILAAVALQEIQEAVKQASGGREQEEQEQETNSAKALLQTAAEKRHGCDVQEKLGEVSVVKRIRQESVEVSILKNRGTDAKGTHAEAEICLDTIQNTR